MYTWFRGLLLGAECIPHSGTGAVQQAVRRIGFQMKRMTNRTRISQTATSVLGMGLSNRE
jgi:hypothetical protein